MISYNSLLFLNVCLVISFYNDSSPFRRLVCKFPKVSQMDICGNKDATRNKRKNACISNYEMHNIIDYSNGLEADLLLIENLDCSFYSTPKKKLKLVIKSDSRNTIQVKVHDRDNEQFQIPKYILNHKEIELFRKNIKSRCPDTFENCVESQEGFYIIYTKKPFSFQIIRNNQILFNFTDDFVFEEQFIKFSTSLPINANIYGLNQVTSDNLRRNPNKTIQTLWNRDTATPKLENQYGSHPFYLELRDGLAHGVVS